MFKRHLNWTLFAGGYFLSSITRWIGLTVGRIIDSSTGYRLSETIIGIPSFIFMIVPYIWISAWYLKNKARSNWHLLWPLLIPAICFMFIPWWEINEIEDEPLILGLTYLAGLVPLFLLKNKAAEPMAMMHCPVHENRIAFNTCADCERPVCSLCEVKIGDSSLCRSCFETKHITVVELNWFKRHLNWTYGIVSAVAVIMPPALMILPVSIKLPSQSSELGFYTPWVLMALVVIACGIWVIVLKGLPLWLVAAALWPFIPALIILNRPPSTAWFDTKFFEFYFWLYGGMIINVIVLLFLGNQRYRQITTTEDGKVIKRWYRISAQAQPEIEQEKIATSPAGSSQ